MLAAVADRRNSTAFAMIIPTMFHLQAYTYALAVNFIPAYRDPADAIGHSAVGLVPRDEGGSPVKEKEGSIEKGMVEVGDR
jgi:MFS transporter, FHS family, L-fucose permease